MSRNSGKQLMIPAGKTWLSISTLLLSLAGQARLANAQEKTVGGHAGFGFPLVTHDSDNTTTLGDTFQMSLPVAITVNGSGRMYFDLEFVPHVIDKPREITLTVNPGILWRLGHGWSAG